MGVKENFKFDNENKAKNKSDNQEIMFEIKDMIEDVHKDLKKIVEKSNEDYMNLMYNNLKNEFLGSINDYMLDKIDPELEQRIINPCDMRKQCKNVFKEYLKKRTHDLRPGKLNKEKSRNEFKELKKVKSKTECDACFNEVSNIYESHIALINSITIYDNQRYEEKKKISDIDEKNLVQSVLDPISHEKRLKILKTVAIEPQSFSQLSKSTNLKGGNLIFHINKLQENELIFQKQDHGEYILTTKGLKIVKILLRI
ncbi:MAG: winged helix-turn-helix domain-containing protein [Methanobrevibacter sp.]|jgi:predicted transcriptional regulator|nr:winged helix-turn-helix domain-containing protein [Candidatus Methanovirga aequatorialis]